MIPALTYILTGLFSAVGLYHLKEKNLHLAAYPAVMWLSATLALEVFAAFGANPGISLTLVYRLLNFIYPAIAVLAGLGIYKILKEPKGIKQRQLLKSMILTFILITFISSSYTINANIMGEGRYTGYQWVNTQTEFKQMSWLSKHIGGDQDILGDVKVRSIATYFALDVDVGKGYSLLKSGEKSGEYVFFTYELMLRNGYLLGLYGERKDLMWKTLGGINRIYDNGKTELYKS